MYQGSLRFLKDKPYVYVLIKMLMYPNFEQEKGTENVFSVKVTAIQRKREMYKNSVKNKNPAPKIKEQ